MARIRDERLTIRIPGEKKKQFGEQAKKEDRSLSGWILHTLNKAVPSGENPGRGKSSR